MGNLYTHIVRTEPNPRIQILSQLKAAWNTYPRPFAHIHLLQEKLRLLQNKHTGKRKKLIGIFH